jgi:hypothetical protein
VVYRQVNPGLGRLRIKGITVPVTDRFIKLTIQRSGPGLAKTVRTVLSGMLGLAVRHGALSHNPIRDVARITRPPRPVRAMTTDEVVMLRALVRDDASARALDLPDLIRLGCASAKRVLFVGQLWISAPASWKSTPLWSAPRSTV